jgi:hypothetical protein
VLPTSTKLNTETVALKHPRPNDRHEKELPIIVEFKIDILAPLLICLIEVDEPKLIISDKEILTLPRSLFTKECIDPNAPNDLRETHEPIWQKSVTLNRFAPLKKDLVESELPNLSISTTDSFNMLPNL